MYLHVAVISRRVVMKASRLLIENINVLSLTTGIDKGKQIPDSPHLKWVCGVFFQAGVEEMVSDPTENGVGIDYFVLSQRA